MVWNSAILLLIAAAAAPALAEEPSNCQVPKVRHNVTAIQDANNFCTMFPPMGVNEVAPSEACALSTCVGNPTGDKLLAGNPRVPPKLILSSHFYENKELGYVQITGCFDPTVWKLNPADGGGQMDSHGWRYRCAGYGKFLSLLEPSEGQYCIRCCKGDDKDPNCDTAHSTHGCYNLIPGDYTMPDGSNCPRPAGAPPVALPSTSTSAAAGTPTPPPTGNPPATGGNTPNPATPNPATPNTPNTPNANTPKGSTANTSTSGDKTGNSGARVAFSAVGMVAAGALALAAAL